MLFVFTQFATCLATPVICSIHLNSDHYSLPNSQFINEKALFLVMNDVAELTK